jgi:enoyl-CoA hydratase
MGQYENVRYAVEGTTAIITIDHPPANAFNRATVLDLKAAFDEASADDNVKVIVITGAGQFFVAGADINEFKDVRDAATGETLARQGQMLFSQIENSRKPVIAAINGRVCLGGGNELALACHIRIAEESVQFGQPEIKLGIMPAWGGTQRLPRLVGKGLALEMCLTGDNIKAQEAYRIGMVNKVVPVGTVVREATRMAKVLGMWGGVALGNIIQSVNEGLDLPVEEGFKNEAKLFGAICETEDMQEGASAFLEKRRPQFKNR